MTPDRQPQHCDHEFVCIFFRHDSRIAWKDGTRCMANQEGCKICNEDTRSRPHTHSSTPAPEQPAELTMAIAEMTPARQPHPQRCPYMRTLEEAGDFCIIKDDWVGTKICGACIVSTHREQVLEKVMNKFLTDELDPEYIIRERLHIEIEQAKAQEEK